MLKKLLLAFVCSCAAAISYAQPTLTAANTNPALNDSFIYVTCQVAGVTIPGSSGANQTWNYSTLADTNISDSVYVGSVIYANAASSYGNISTAATALSITAFSSSNYATVDPATTIANYFAESSTKLSNTALYVDASDYSVYTTPIVALQYPFTYLNTFTSAYAGYVATYLSSTPGHVSGSVQVTADAYGTLILPPTPPSSTPSSYSGVLRVHSYQVFIDSLDIFSEPVNEPDTINTYAWYLPGYHTALLSISTNHSPVLNETTITYARKQIANHEAVTSVNLDASLKVFPNPAASVVNVEFDNNTGSDVRVSLVDMLGREVAVMAEKLQAGYNYVSYNTASIPRGSYLVHLQSASQSVTRNIEIQ